MRPASGVAPFTLLECWTELLLAAVAIRTPLRQRYLKVVPLRRRAPLSEVGLRSTLRALDRAASHHLKPMTCLERSAAGQRILRRRGIPAELHLGVRHSATGRLEAHAWIEIDGKPVDGLASDFAPLERHGHGRLAGIRLVASTDLPLPDDGTETDADCCVLLGPPPSGGRVEWQELPPHPGGGRAWVRGDGRSVTLEGPAGGGETLAGLLRWAVPFASALQARVILHASAVARDGRVWAFVGESGAGKSTLVRALSKRGWSAVTDDLLPCRLNEGLGGKAGGEQAAVAVLSGRERFGLSAVFFVERTAPLAEVRAERLAPAEGLHLLLRHGFGELSSERMWRSQFEVYGTLAERVATYRVEAPDDLGRLEEIAALLEERMRA